MNVWDQNDQALSGIVETTFGVDAAVGFWYMEKITVEGFLF